MNTFQNKLGFSVFLAQAFKRSRRLVQNVCFILVASILSSGIFAQGQQATQILNTRGRWEIKDKRAAVVVEFSQFLAAKQRQMIDSGFTTFSVLTLEITSSDQPPAGRNQAQAAAGDHMIFRVGCSVKFDTWEERYDVVRLDEKPVRIRLKDFHAYSNECLSATIYDERSLKLLQQGATLVAKLNVKQTSADESAKIKDWLVKQQSGVMQGLFSHMLGDLALSAVTTVQVTIPPRPSTTQKQIPNPRIDSSIGHAVDTPNTRAGIVSPKRPSGRDRLTTRAPIKTETSPLARPTGLPPLSKSTNRASSNQRSNQQRQQRTE